MEGWVEITRGTLYIFIGLFNASLCKSGQILILLDLCVECFTKRDVASWCSTYIS